MAEGYEPNPNSISNLYFKLFNMQQHTKAKITINQYSYFAIFSPVGVVVVTKHPNGTLHVYDPSSIYTNIDATKFSLTLDTWTYLQIITNSENFIFEYID